MTKKKQNTSFVWKLNLFHQFSSCNLSFKSSSGLVVHIPSPIFIGNQRINPYNHPIISLNSHMQYMHHFMHNIPSKTGSFKDTILSNISMPIYNIPAETGTFIKDEQNYSHSYMHPHASSHAWYFHPKRNIIQKRNQHNII